MFTKTRKSVANATGWLYQRLLTILESRGFVYFIFIWFLIEAIYMAVATRHGLPPDEHYHDNFIRFFTTSGWTPFISNQPVSYHLGEVAHTPFFLYHYLLSLPGHIMYDSPHEVFIYRMFNVLLGAGTLFLTLRLGNLLRIPKAARNLALFMLANTMMFVFLSGAVSYDGLFVFVSVAGVLALCLLYEKVTLKRVLLLAVCVLAGLMVKINFLPVAGLLFLAFVWKLATNWRGFWKGLAGSWRQSKRWNIGLGILALLLFGLFCQRYVYNVAKYHTVTPSCQRIMTYEQCLRDPVFARDQRIAKWSPPTQLEAKSKYVQDWIKTMNEGTYGIQAHQSIPPSDKVELSIMLIFVVAWIGFIRHYKRRDWRLNIPILITAAYAFTLIARNYHTYHRTGLLTFAVQGRYFLALLPILYLLACYYLWQYIRRPLLRVVLTVWILLTFFVSALPAYIVRTDGSNWHTPGTVKFNHHLSSYLEKLGVR